MQKQIKQKKNKQMINPIFSFQRMMWIKMQSLIWLESTKRWTHLKMINLITTLGNGFLCLIHHQAFICYRERKENNSLCTFIYLAQNNEFLCGWEPAWTYISFSHIIILLQNSRWQLIENRKQIQKFQSLLNIHTHSSLYLIYSYSTSVFSLITLDFR